MEMTEARNTWQTIGYPYGYSHAYRKRRSKADWAGVGIGEAYKANLDVHLRLQAQRLFQLAMKKTQAEAARMTGCFGNTEYQPKVKPQLGPCYTTYPSMLSAYAAIGLSAFLEFESWVEKRLLAAHLKDYLADPAGADRVHVDPDLYKEVVMTVVESINTRLLIEILTRNKTLFAIELYRLFSASLQGSRFGSLDEIINAAVLYGDIFPDWRGMDLHPLTRAVLGELTVACNPFFDRLSTVNDLYAAELGAEWVRAVCPRLSVFLPRPQKTGGGKDSNGDDGNQAKSMMDQIAELFGVKQPRFSEDQHDMADRNQIAPLNAPNPPTLHGLGSPAANKLMNALRTKNNEIDQYEVIDDFGKAIEEAASQKQTWEDMRSDILEGALGKKVFHEGPIEGNPVEGHEITAHLGRDQTAGGIIFDCPLELSDDLSAMEVLLDESRPVTEALKQSLYPNIRQVPETQYLRTSGSLDPARLAMAEFSSVVFKRSRIREKPDKSGRPVLVIACDGSGSLNSSQMHMVKILASGWLNSTVKSDMQVLAGLYHSGTIKAGTSGSLVQWIYHPRKTPVISRRDATRCLVSLPDTGTGVQSDALSLDFIMEEADSLAHNNMIYLTVLSDTEWNRSYRTEKSGKEEVYAFFENAYERFSGRLHVTLVALGVPGDTGFEKLLNKVIVVPYEELEDFGAVAKKVAVYVASCIRERKKLMKNAG